jgi:hypothetical protein
VNLPIVRPIEAAVVLLPLYELLQLNPVFSSVIAESLSQETPSKRPPMIFSFLSLASYLFSHASSVGTPRSLAYANLAMKVCLMISKDEPLVTKLAREAGSVRICRQVKVVLSRGSALTYSAEAAKAS